MTYGLENYMKVKRILWDGSIWGQHEEEWRRFSTLSEAEVFAKDRRYFGIQIRLT